MEPLVLVDEAHQQGWTTRSGLAARMQPAHPADVSLAGAAASLRAAGFAVRARTGGLLDAAALRDVAILVLPHAADPARERTTGTGSARFTTAELDAVESWVREGGGLLVLGESEQDASANGLNDLLARFGMAIVHDTVQDYERCRDGVPTWIKAVAAAPRRGAHGDAVVGVDDLCFLRAGTVAPGPAGRVLARTSPTATTPDAPLAALAEAGRGRVCALADSDLFGDDDLDAGDHRAFLVGLAHALARPAFAAPAARPRSALTADPAWPALREAVDELRALQAPDGSLRDPVGDGERAAALVCAVRAAIGALAVHVPHQAEHLASVDGDLAAWSAGGFGVPDFARALQTLRPDLRREDGVEHLVVAPMAKQNASRDKVFEALAIRTRWPAWLADLERERYANAKFVPVCFSDHTAGYSSECAVLFPETIAATGAVPNHFGAIFCDREAERFRRVATAACDLLGVNVRADAAALLASEALTLDAFALWDLVHDRQHSLGDLPFDPFMVRQRSPYWTYALEELRCDLFAFGEAVELEREGLALARHVQTAILFDRLFRFPVTGERVRNYDGLGGQLLFAALHRHGSVRWTDNCLTIDWATVADGVASLREEVEALYRAGIDRSKLAQWGAAHDLVARYVPPAAGSRWAAGARSFAEASDPRPYLDEVEPDEFPLSMFYVQLRAKLADMVARPPRVRRAGQPVVAAVAA